LFQGNSILKLTKLPGNSKKTLKWMLNTNVFNSIIEEFGWPEIDLFTSSENKQIEKYISWKPEPEAYIFPPFSIIGRILRKIQQDQTRCILDRLAVQRLQFQPSMELLPSNGKQIEHNSEFDSLTKRSKSVFEASIKNSTKKKYNTYLNKWHRFCSEKK